MPVTSMRLVLFMSCLPMGNKGARSQAAANRSERSTRCVMEGSSWGAEDICRHPQGLNREYHGVARPWHTVGVYDFDVLVLGSGPGGQKAAIAAAKLARRVGVVERRHMVGGVCINTGTIPSKTLREAVLYLTGLNQREMYGQSYRLKDDITVADLAARTQHVIGREIDVIRSQLARNRVKLLTGTARFHDPHTLTVRDDSGREALVSADKIIVAAGTRPARPSTVAFDECTVIDSDGVVNLEHVPHSMVVVGAGVIGIEYASMFAA